MGEGHWTIMFPAPVAVFEAFVVVVTIMFVIWIWKFVVSLLTGGGGG